MKKILKSLALAALALLVFSCGEPEPEVVTKPSLNIETKNIEFVAEGGSSTITFTSNVDWTASCDASWLTLSAVSGSGSNAQQTITVTSDRNGEFTDRTAKVALAVSTSTQNVIVVQKGMESEDGVQTVTIAEFLKLKTDETKWYRIVADVASVNSYEYGNIYITDDTGSLYVYGVTREKQNKVGDNDKSFESLGIKPGDRISIIGTKYIYNSLHEVKGAYLEKLTPGTYNGWKAAGTKAGWMELPATSDADGREVLAHMFHTSGFESRSYSSYWDYEHLVSLWVAYPLYSKAIGSGSRSDSWAFDPLLSTDSQVNICKNSYSPGNGGTYVRGHQLPSADRLNYKDNLETFFCTNVFPQNSSLNEGVWGSLEKSVRTWSKNCDTLYVVTGVDIGGSTTYVLDNAGKHVTVPKGCFKALLRFSQKDGYSAVGFYSENKEPSASETFLNTSMSISDLEKKVGFDFFVNLPAAVGDAEAADIEKADPSTLSWLWN